MKKLLISTRYPVAVSSLLSQNDFVNNAEMIHSCLEADYPDDALSQAFDLWLVLAKGCGLIDGYQLVEETKNNPFCNEIIRDRQGNEIARAKGVLT
ncbi:MAG TPA: hypothetical protein VHV10_16985 [Ktedonobacteraceae bacterium]|nr:hypothetical protein [Ktedonobacteraceae bacterium]